MVTGDYEGQVHLWSNDQKLKTLKVHGRAVDMIVSLNQDKTFMASDDGSSKALGPNFEIIYENKDENTHAFNEYIFLISFIFCCFIHDGGKVGAKQKMMMKMKKKLPSFRSTRNSGKENSKGLDTCHKVSFEDQEQAEE